MKRILLIIIAGLTFVTIGCDSTKEEPENPEYCCSPSPNFHLYIDKSSSLYQDFLNDKGEFDEQNVYFYQLSNKNTEKKYKSFLDNTPKRMDGYAVIYIDYFSLRHTGKTETFYLKNKKKSYKIEFVGTQGKCCNVQFKELHIDGVKNDNFILK